MVRTVIDGGAFGFVEPDITWGVADDLTQEFRDHIHDCCNPPLASYHR